MTGCFHIDTKEVDGQARVSIKAKGSDEEILQMLLDGICAFAAQSQHELKPSQIIKLLGDSLEEWE